MMFAIDPGVQECACAVAVGGHLREVRSLDPREMPSSNVPACDVIWEIPQADGRKVPTADLLRLTHLGADFARAIAGRTHSIRAVTPREWKGSVPKPIHHARLWTTLNSKERALLGGDKTLNAIDGACERGAVDGWKKEGKLYYKARELPFVDGRKITHDKLDAAALLLFGLGRLRGP